MTISHDRAQTADIDDDTAPGGLGRRKFIGYVMGGTALVAAADIGLGFPLASPAAAVGEGIPSPPQIANIYDLEDLQNDAAAPTANLITISVDRNGIAHFAIPRTEVGQGITTSTAVIIAEELDMKVENVRVTLAPGRPELMYNQLTGGSNTTFSTYTPIRVAAAVAKRALLSAAVIESGYALDRLKTYQGLIILPEGKGSIKYGDLVDKASELVDRTLEVTLKQPSDFTLIGKSHNRIDALDAVTGKKHFAMDLKIKGALPTMVCRPPTHRASPKKLLNTSTILKMPGVTDVAKIPTGIAVRARTFGQCIDAIRAMKVAWNPGPVDDLSDFSTLQRIRAAELPLTTPEVPEGVSESAVETVEGDFVFAFRSSAALEPYACVADVRSDHAKVWACMKSPLLTQQRVAEALGFSQDQVDAITMTGGGSFGHKLFYDHAVEAALISQAIKKPVRLMWHRADEPRQGRQHPMCTSRIRATVDTTAGNVLSFEQQHTGIRTDYSHGLGEIYASQVDEAPTNLGGYSISQGIFALTESLPYNFGSLNQVLEEEPTTEDFFTGAMRNVYSPDVCTAAELMVDQIGKKLGLDPYEVRKKFIKSERVLACLNEAAKKGNWGKNLGKHRAQGIAVHEEYKGCTAVLVEIDCRPETVNRKIYDAVTGPRVTKVVVAVDPGLVINPRGYEAQMQGGAMDGIAQTLTSSVHLRNGQFLEASWDNYFYTRQWNVPPEVEVHFVDSRGETPGGAGEAAVGSTMAATACAYARATGKVPTYFPINHGTISFKPKTFIPPIPPSPTNGLKFTY